MGKRLRQLGELSLDEWKVLVSSLFLLPSIALNLKLLGYKKTKSLLAYFMPHEHTCKIAAPQELDEVYAIARVVHIAARHSIFKTNCLKQALVLWFFLGRKLISSEIKFGVAMGSQEKFSAHAWVECNGEPLIDTEDAIKNFSAF